MRTDFIVYHWTDQEVLEGMKQVNSSERKVRIQWLSLLAEVDRRGLHLELGYSSLCSFVMEELNHSESEALKRIKLSGKQENFRYSTTP